MNPNTHTVDSQCGTSVTHGHEPNDGGAKAAHASTGTIPSVARLFAQYPNLARRNSWVIHSPKESAATDDDAGFWSNHWGWTTLDHASVFLGDERFVVRMPLGRDDIEWRSLMRMTLAQAEVDLDAFDVSSIDDQIEYVAIELQGVTISDGVCQVCDSDPQFYGLYLRGADGLAHHAADFYTYIDAFKVAYSLSHTKKLPLTRAPGNMDRWFLVAVGQAKAAYKA